jgi:glycosyltransferase involved in cell wall biosynthesis
MKKAKIIWIYFIEADLNSHITTWREMYYQLKDDFDVHYLFPYRNSKTGFTENIHFIPTNKIFGFRRVAFAIAAFKTFRRLYKELKPEYVVLDDWSFFFSVIRVFSEHKAKFIYDSRTPLYGQWTNKRVSNILRGYIKYVLKYNRKYHDGLTCISPELRDIYERDLKMKLNSKFCAWPSGVNLFDFDSSRYICINKGSKIKMIFHGSITNTRGLENAIKGLSILRDENIDFEFSIYGEGAYGKYFQNLINEYSVSDQIKIYGSVEYTHIPKIIAENELAIMTYPQITYWEGNVPLKLLEYIAMGKFVLCTQLNVFKKMAGDYPKIIYIENNEPATIAKGVKKYLEIKNSFCNQEIKIDKIIEQYSWKKIANNFKIFLSSFSNEQ